MRTEMHQEHPRLLIVDDDEQLTELLIKYLAPHGFSISHVSSGDAASERILSSPPDLVILDLMLPGANGLDVCRQVRAKYSGSLLILTASQSEADHVTGLELGADDFVNKPIEPRILLARIRTQLRRRGRLDATHVQQEEGVFALGPLRVDSGLRDVRVGGELVPLTTMEFDIVLMLASQAGSVVERDQLYADILGTEYDGIDRGMDVHVSRIRRKLQRCGFDPSRLKSVRGVGYLLAYR